MTPLTYRDAVPGDAAEIAAVARQSFTETFGHLYDPADLASFLTRHSPEAWRHDLLRPDLAVRLAVAGAEIAGYAKVGPVTLPVTPQGEAAELQSLYLLKPWHGTGAARTLMDWALAEAARRGARELYLSVYIDNHRARRFYYRYGFTYVGPYAFMVGNHADEDEILRLDLRNER